MKRNQNIFSIIPLSLFASCSDSPDLSTPNIINPRCNNAEDFRDDINGCVDYIRAKTNNNMIIWNSSRIRVASIPTSVEVLIEKRENQSLTSNTIYSFLVRINQIENSPGNIPTFIRNGFQLELLASTSNIEIERTSGNNGHRICRCTINSTASCEECQSGVCTVGESSSNCSYDLRTRIYYSNSSSYPNNAFFTYRGYYFAISF